ncbi:MAG: isoprenyl transferase [Deltaproteobacteria bacterium]|nr:isoprenyl transferase [Deltaproteobacteria bacterium]MBW2070011.1 isoprenyl transferase [Deltaproteobacteria bacterium]
MKTSTLEKLPQHLAIIMDGNGRWAKQRNLTRIEGHRQGAESVRLIVRACRKIGIPVLTLYAFSKENWQRPSLEVQALWQLLRDYLKSELSEMLENGIRLNTLGNIEDLPGRVKRLLRDTMQKTAANKDMILNLALSYSGRDEIVRAARRLATLCSSGQLTAADIREETLSSFLDTGGMPDPDLLIRTSGEYRLSNFMLWQLAYTEIYITPVYWPDFREEQLMEALFDFQQRERRFGKTSEQLGKEA